MSETLRLERGEGTLGWLISEPGKSRLICLLLLKIKYVLEVILHHLLLLMDVVSPRG